MSFHPPFCQLLAEGQRKYDHRYQHQHQPEREQYFFCFRGMDGTQQFEAEQEKKEGVDQQGETPAKAFSAVHGKEAKPG